MTSEHLSTTLARLLEPVPVCAHPDCSRDLLDVARGARYCGARCRSAHTAAERQRRARARKRSAKLAGRAHLLAVADGLIRQTRKRAKGSAVLLTAGAVADGLLAMPEVERAEVIRVLRGSPERAPSEDAWHRRDLYGASVDYRASVEEVYRREDPDLRWCVRNEAAGVLLGGSLGYVRKPTAL